MDILHFIFPGQAQIVEDEKQSAESAWDPIPDAGGYENVTANQYSLLPKKWRKDKEGA